MARILIIDDDPMMCDVLSRAVRGVGHDAVYAFTLTEGLREAAKGRFDVVFLDVQMPDGNGLEVLPKMRRMPSSPEVIIMTGRGDPDGAELAINSGAWDYIEKPASVVNMTLPLVRALQYREEKQSRVLGDGVKALNRGGIIGNSPLMKVALDLLAQAADSDLNVLISGETGTGKELFALAIHNNSARSAKPFVVLDCSALPETLVESMLFGHDRGAFTGADRAREGLIKQADGGTLFLDEVGELPLSLQKAFLRVLQERRFRPLGGRREIESNFRLVAATNRDLGTMVQNGQFRNDLLFRLRSFAIELPPLRKHTEDIKDLAIHYMAKFCERHGMGIKGFSPDFLEALIAYDWPGNVRELVNSMERALIEARHEPTLFVKHLSHSIRIHLARASLTKTPIIIDPPKPANPHPGSIPRLREYREAADREYLQKLMALTSGTIKEACEISGLSRSRLYELLKKLQLSDFT
jgi:two-component system NtrC family response regulator